MSFNYKSFKDYFLPRTKLSFNLVDQKKYEGLSIKYLVLELTKTFLKIL